MVIIVKFTVINDIFSYIAWSSVLRSMHEHVIRSYLYAQLAFSCATLYNIGLVHGNW